MYKTFKKILHFNKIKLTKIKIQKSSRSVTVVSNSFVDRL